MASNPFENDIETDPRRIETPLSGLNEDPLTGLTARFELIRERVRQGAVWKPDKAQLVVSPHAGFGKSHLIGRLFRSLSGRANLIYLRPFENPASCWRSILSRLVAEMNSLELTAQKPEQAGGPTQLEVFTHTLFTGLGAAAIREGLIHYRNPERVASALAGSTFKEFKQNLKALKWLLSLIGALAGMLEEKLTGPNLALNTPARDWLRVLYILAYLPLDPPRRQIYFDWLKGGHPEDPLPWSKNGTGKINGLAERNEICKGRLQDLCVLASFSRPFLFCFDQTEYYGKREDLSRSFAGVIWSLVDETRNQMTVITANQKPWQERISPHWEDAELARLINAPLELDGLSRYLARKMIDQRLAAMGTDRQNYNFMTNRFWLDQVFKAGGGQMGVRHFLWECSQRWEQLGPGDSGEQTLDELFAGTVEKFLTHPDRLVFDADILHWLLSEVAAGFSHLKPEENRSAKNYFPLVWRLKDGITYFGFEDGTNASTWKAIAEKAEGLYLDDPRIKVVFIRTAELAGVPQPTWKKISVIVKRAQQTCLDIVPLDRTATAWLHASRELYIQAVEGSLFFGPDEIKDFVRDKFKVLWKRILRKIPR